MPEKLCTFIQLKSPGASRTRSLLYHNGWHPLVEAVVIFFPKLWRTNHLLICINLPSQSRLTWSECVEAFETTVNYSSMTYDFFHKEEAGP